MAITTIIKRLLGVEDVNWDTDGSDSRFPVETSTGGTRSVKRVNSSDIPSTTAAREKKRIGSATPTTGGKDVDGHLQEIYDDLAKIGQPDGTTIQEEDGVLSVGEITATQIATGAVDTAEIAAGAVEAAGLDTDAVETLKIKDEAVTSGKIADLAVTSGKIALLGVDEEQLAVGAVTPLKMDMDGNNKTFSHYLFAAGTLAYAGGASEYEHPVASVAATDLVSATMKFSTANVDLRRVVPDTGTLTFYWTSGSDGSATAPGADTEVYYFVWKPVVT